MSHRRLQPQRELARQGPSSRLGFLVPGGVDVRLQGHGAAGSPPLRKGKHVSSAVSKGHRHSAELAGPHYYSPGEQMPAGRAA